MTKSNNTLPRGWQIKTLAQIGSFSKGKGITKAEIVETGKPCIRYGQIYFEYHYFVEEFKSFINDTSAFNSERIYKNDLLFAGSGETLEDIGKCVAYIKDDEAYAGGDIIILRPKSEDAHYLGYLFNSDDFRRQTFKLGQGHSVVHIYSSSLKNVKVALPPQPEQEKIAKILATWDKAIALQQKLIANKKENKRVVMKKLMNGEVRFKGFDEDWKELKMNEVFFMQAGKDMDLTSYNLSKSETHIHPVYSNAIQNEGLYGWYNNFQYEGNKITVTARGGLGVANPRSQKFNAIGRLLILTPKTEVNIKFASDYINNIVKIFVESTGVPQLTAPQFSAYKIKLPHINEQNKITFYSITIDNEIAAMEKGLNVLQNQKKGLMQQLLTGKIRVKN